MGQLDLEKDVQIGDFRIEKRLGAGGMGVVYQARQISLNRTVALKILGNALTGPAEISRFRREAQAAAKLEHPGIARIYFVGQNERLCYMAMELVNGEALQTLDAIEGLMSTIPLASATRAFMVLSTSVAVPK
jgi:serine/threonine-protein kinase